ncbi:MAG: hypothetical protein JZD40_00705 [Sulfolobus sp.]|nr:hypothetical protein [Sulfolobus sp.]
MYHYGKEKGLETARVKLILNSPIRVISTDEDKVLFSSLLDKFLDLSIFP